MEFLYHMVTLCLTFWGTNCFLKWLSEWVSVKVAHCVWLFETPWTQWTVSPWNSPGQNTGVGSLSLLQEIFPIQGSNPGLLHCSRILYQLSSQGSQGEVPVLLIDFALFRATIWCCCSCVLTIKAVMDILKRQNWYIESIRCCNIVYPLN